VGDGTLAVQQAAEKSIQTTSLLTWLSVQCFKQILKRSHASHGMVRK
jgi:hypothetical protein